MRGMRQVKDFIVARSASKIMMLDKNTSSSKKVKNGDVMRLTCILVGVFLFIAIALVTTLSVLGVMKTIYVWALLTSDISEEETSKGNIHNINSNIQKLNKSLDKETMYSSFCLILSGFGLQLCCASSVLLYGLVLNKAQVLYAWIVFSSTNISCLSIIVFFLEKFTKIQLQKTGIDYCILGLTIFIVSYNLLLHCHAKTLSKKHKIIVKAYGGYTHTVSPNQQLPSEKQSPENFII